MRLTKKRFGVALVAACIAACGSSPAEFDLDGTNVTTTPSNNDAWAGYVKLDGARIGFVQTGLIGPSDAPVYIVGKGLGADGYLVPSSRVATKAGDYVWYDMSALAIGDYQITPVQFKGGKWYWWANAWNGTQDGFCSYIDTSETARRLCVLQPSDASRNWDAYHIGVHRTSTGLTSWRQ